MTEIGGEPVTIDGESPGVRYLRLAADLIEQVRVAEWPRIAAAAELVADALAAGRSLHVFGTGHSHMLAEELFYRAGGLVRVSPILFEGLMLHASATLGTTLERLPELADALLADHPMGTGDVLVVASNSGSNAVASQLVLRARQAGVRVIAVTSIRHATSASARGNDLPRLHELADVVIDNNGAVGDAAVDVRGFDRRVGPTSTVVGAAILNAVVAHAVQVLVDRGLPPDVYTSSNLEGGDDANASFARRAAAG
jgi:uncharacterized phosphosugar-binding protein